MKKFFYCLPLILICLSGCGKKQPPKISQSESTPSGISESDSSQEELEYIDPFYPEGNSTDGIDYDLSNLNYNLVSAMNFEMAIDPERFYGKTVKMRGQFFTDVEPESNTRFYYCVLYDATACCQAGVDFQMTGNKVFPDDFPAEGTNIEVVGVYKDFSDMLNDGRSYAGLLCDKITVLN